MIIEQPSCSSAAPMSRPPTALARRHCTTPRSALEFQELSGVPPVTPIVPISGIEQPLWSIANHDSRSALRTPNSLGIDQSDRSSPIAWTNRVLVWNAGRLGRVSRP